MDHKCKLINFCGMLMQAKAAESQNVATVVENKSAASPSVRTIQSVIAARLSKEVY